MPHNEIYGAYNEITDPESFFPFHNVCLSIVEHVVSQKSDHSITGLAALEVLYRKLDGLRESLKEDPDKITGKGIEWEHGYYGARRFWWEGPTLEHGWEFLFTDPFCIADLTDYILSNLQSMPNQPQSLPVTKAQQVLQSPKATLDSLPVELLDRITSYLSCSTILHLHRTNRALSTRIHLSQSFWRDQLVSGSLIPFLWDLDALKCRGKEIYAPIDGSWDWRLLAYTLKKEPFVEVALRKRCSEPFGWPDEWIEKLDLWRDLSKNAESQLKGTPPMGLINRARILRIIEEALVWV